MKIYVTGFKPKPDYAEALEAGRPMSDEDAYDIFFNVEPHWTFPYRELAEGELRILLPMRVHVGQHYCQLEVKEIGEEKYAIVCNEHPDLVRK